MAQLIEESLLQALKKDDKKAFDALMKDAQCGAYRLGRFPVLSLAYLYKSKKIISAYEATFIKITAYEALREPAEISKKFSAKAGKCLRLYLSETVTPLEMLLILDKTRTLKRVYPLTKPPQAVKARLQSIYSIRYSLGVKFEGNDIIIDKRPLSYREKKNIVTACVSVLLVAAVAVGAPLTTIALIPEPKPDEFAILKEELASKEDYILTDDLVLPENFSAEKVNCKIIGNGKKLVLRTGASLGAFNGEMSDLTIESSGSPVFTTVSQSATISDITVNVTSSISTAENYALIALANYGTIEGVTVNIGGTLTAVAGEDQSTIIVGGLVLNNAYSNSQAYGVIKNCTVNYSDFSITGSENVNAAFGGIAGANNAEIIGCTVTGNITADTFDLAGISVTNSGLLSGDINEADLFQTSGSSGWNPNTCGIVYSNSYAVEYCKNTGIISAVSTYEKSKEEENMPIAIAAGIACENDDGQIVASENHGSVTAKGGGTVFIGGIASRSWGPIAYCLSDGEISASADSVWAGGILGRNEIVSNIFNMPVYDFVRYCISDGKISVTADGEKSYVGGVVGFVMQGSYTNSDIYFGGGATNCYFTGECVSELTRFGNIVGVCGVNLYDNNSYTSGDTEYHNFDGNFYAANNYTAFGAAIKFVDETEEFIAVADKGATAATREEIENSETYLEILSKLSQ